MDSSAILQPPEWRNLGILLVYIGKNGDRKFRYVQTPDRRYPVSLHRGKWYIDFLPQETWPSLFWCLHTIFIEAINH